MDDHIGIVEVVGACASLAQVTYKKCRDCPGDFQDFKDQAKALQQTLEDLSDLIREHELTGPIEDECWERAGDCKEVLETLEATIDKLHGVGKCKNQPVNPSDETRRDNDPDQNLKDRLNTSLYLVTKFYEGLITSPQLQVEKALRTLFEAYRDGVRDINSLVRLTAIEGEIQDSEAWPYILSDLQSVFLDKDTAEQNRHSIVNWLFRAKPVLLPSRTDVDDTSVQSLSPQITELTFPYRTRSDTTDNSSVGSPISISTQQRLMEPFGKAGAQMDEKAQRGEISFRDDLNRGREYWKRKNWVEVKKNLLPVVVAAQLPTHRRLDINPKMAVFLTGVAHSNSGDLEMAKSIMLSILTPLDVNATISSSYESPILASDDGQIAAATWLGDICIKTNRLESAALAWALAFNAVLKKAQDRDQLASTPTLQTRETSKLANSSSPPPPPPKESSASSTARNRPLQHIDLQTRTILGRLAYCHQKTNNINSLLDSLESHADLDGDHSAFTQTKLTTTEHMIHFAKITLNAVERADSSVLTRSRSIKDSHTRARSSSNTKSSPSRSSGEITRHGAISTSTILPAEDFLISPVRSSGWPLEWDHKFQVESAMKTIDWFFSFTELSGEGVLHDIPLLNSNAIKNHPAVFVDHFDEKESDKFIRTLGILLQSLGFEYKERPAGLRCRNKTDGPSQFASIACFELRIAKYRTSLLPRTKLAAYICNILHWDNFLEEKSIRHRDTVQLLSEMKSQIKIREAEAKSKVIPSSGSNNEASAA